MNELQKELERIKLTCHADGGSNWSSFVSDCTKNPCLRALLGGPVNIEGLQALWRLISAAPFDEYLCDSAWNYLADSIQQLTSPEDFQSFKTEYPIPFPFKQQLGQLLSEIDAEMKERG